MTVFYRKYRPQKLADLIGQDHVREALLTSLESGKISHGYLFAGPRGSGKTSTARILAKAVNCEVYGRKSTDKKAVSGSPKFGEPCNKCNACQAITNGSYLDLIEIDAASNRRIDEIRDLQDKIKLSPVSGRFKVYIIDEVHMLTTEAFNALLKTLEEPPAHAIFVLCTTLPEKIPATIISRLTRFNFKRATQEDLARAIIQIAKAENIKIEKEAVGAIAKAADGAYRDAFSILDQLASGRSAVTQKDVETIYKLTSEAALYELLFDIFAGDLAGSVAKATTIGATGDVGSFTSDAIILLEKLLFIKIGIPGKEEDDRLGELASKATYSQIQNLMKLFLVVEGEMKLYPLPEISLVLAICKFLPKVEEDDALRSPRQLGESSDASVLRPSASDTVRQNRTLVKTSPHVESPRAEERPIKSKKNTGDLGEIEAKWGEFLGKVRPMNAHVVALLRSARPTGFDGANLVVEVFFKFHKEKLEESKIMDLLCGVLESVLGKPVSLKFVLANRTSMPTKTVTVSNVSQIGDDELATMAAEIFSK